MGVGERVQDGVWAQGAGSQWVPKRAWVQVWVQTWPRAVTHLWLLSHHLPPSRSQVFIATNTCRAQLAYGRAMAALLEDLDTFSTAATMAQVLPALHGRSYLDIATMRCHEEPSRSRGSRNGVGTDATMLVTWSPSVPWWFSTCRHADACCP